MNAESSRLRSTGMISTDIRAIWPGTLLVVYLAATGVLLLVSPVSTPPVAVATHFALLVGMGVATWMPVTPAWLRAWAPLLALLFLYSELPTLIAAAGHTDVRDATVVGWEAMLFGSQPAVDWARAVPRAWLSEPLHLAYVSYYPIIVVVPAALYLARRYRAFETAVLVLMVTFVACFTWYIVFPVAGPRYFWTSPAPPGPVRTFATWLLETGSSRGTAFPSSHVAVAMTQSILAVRFFGRRGLVIALLAAGLAAGAVYGGFHYLIDVAAGVVLSAIVCAVALPALGVRDPSGERDGADEIAPGVFGR